MTRLTAMDLHVTLSGRRILEGVDLDVEPGTITAIIGPNGCGKSTLLRSLARIVRPVRGAVTLDGTPLWQRPARDVARRIAFLPQSPQTPEGIRVRALVERGRTPWMGPFRAPSPEDAGAVDAAIAATGLDDLATRRVDRLSGGQRQRAWIALALAQGTPILLLDEPTTFLDLPHQVEILRLARRLNAQTGRTIVMVLHDINLAAQFADRLVALKGGRVLFDGPPAEIVTEARIGALFDMDLRVVADEGTIPLVAPR
ncbi:ABC transporter ATP-binding protein [Palleronia sp. LCG004]|uniref:ABC transporter ATP-binding protein n=1 Tax=Palleronia sp. LCG004 TaxID=3079304 RepID=UPI002942F76A|nr:ABC transporter ATP-binding protein [Palleronia sp. LCG004]WOI57982.1 ABC transporter ATP-binding protein [Palleronia sp. LCG004]